MQLLRDNLTVSIASVEELLKHTITPGKLQLISCKFFYSFGHQTVRQMKMVKERTDYKTNFSAQRIYYFLVFIKVVYSGTNKHAS